MKHKDFCNRCGKLFCVKNLKMDLAEKMQLCQNCYVKQKNDRFMENEPILPPIDLNTPKSLENIKKITRMAENEFYSPTLMNGEAEFIRKKYGYDSFLDCNKECKQVKRLKKAVHDTKLKKEITNNLEKKKRLIKKETNNKFIEGLK